MIYKCPFCNAEVDDVPVDGMMECHRCGEFFNIDLTVYIVYQNCVDELGHDIESFFGVCTTKDQAQAKIDRLVEQFGSRRFAYKPVVLND
jgi:hypothetical protein